MEVRIDYSNHREVSVVGIKRRPADIAGDIRAAAAAAGAQLSVRDDVVSVSLRFVPGDMAAACEAVSTAHDILSLAPRSRPGSTWGGDGVGLDCACRAGFVTVNKSGVNRLIARAI